MTLPHDPAALAELLLPRQILEGIDLFNRGEFYEAHEVMEDAWRATPGDERLLYQGLIQAAVACWRVSQGNARIALTMCARGLPKIDQFRPYFGGIDVEAFHGSFAYLRDQVLALGPQHLAGYDPAQYPKIRFAHSFRDGRDPASFVWNGWLAHDE